MTRTQRSILGVAMLTQGVSVGMTYGILPVFLEPLEAAFSASRTLVSSGQILIMLALTVGSMLTGVALDRGYARGVMLAGALLMGAAQFVAALAPNLWLLGLAALMAGFAVPSIGPLAGASLVTRSFAAERGRALGLMAMGPPLGSGLFAALAGWALVALGWRGAFALFGLLTLVLLLPAIGWVVPARFEPGAGREQPTSSEPSDGAAGDGQTRAADVGMLDVLRMPVFWWTGMVFALAAGVPTGWTVHVAAYLSGVGLDPPEQSTLLAIQFWMGVPGALCFGMLADRLGLTGLFSVMLAGMAAILVGYALFPEPWVVAILGVAMGFATGGMIPLYMLLLGKRLGPDALGRAMGLSNLLMLPVMAVAVLLAASVYEAQGSYTWALAVFALAILAAIGCVFGSSLAAAAALRDRADPSPTGLRAAEQGGGPVR